MCALESEDFLRCLTGDHILLKPGKLTDQEWKEMRKHPEVGYRIVKRIGFLKDAAEIVYTHHEQFDGSG